MTYVDYLVELFTSEGMSEATAREAARCLSVDTPYQRNYADILFQKLLDDTQHSMQEAARRTYSGPAANRVLYSLVTLLTKDQASEAQRQQVETLLQQHQACVEANGVVKQRNKRADGHV